MIEGGGRQVGVFLDPEDGPMLAAGSAVALEISEDEREMVTDRAYQLPRRPRPAADGNGELDGKHV